MTVNLECKILDPLIVVRDNVDDVRSPSLVHQILAQRMQAFGSSEQMKIGGLRIEVSCHLPLSWRQGVQIDMRVLWQGKSASACQWWYVTPFSAASSHVDIIHDCSSSNEITPECCSCLDSISRHGRCRPWNDVYIYEIMVADVYRCLHPLEYRNDLLARSILKEGKHGIHSHCFSHSQNACQIEIGITKRDCLQSRAHCTLALHDRVFTSDLPLS